MKHINPADTNGATRLAFEEAKAQLGGVINLFKIAGNAPNVLSGLLALNKELGASGELDGKLTEQIAMLVSALNRCDYCVNVHMQVGKARGMTETDMLEAMAGNAEGESAQALLKFTDQVVRKRGLVSDATMSRVRAAGFCDKALLETIGIIGLYTTLQYIRHVGHPDHDFPIVASFNPEKHGAPLL
jgi:AhpD family alkylhydroperoxidase